MGTIELNAANYKTVIAGTSDFYTPKSLRTYSVVIGGKYLMIFDIKGTLTPALSDKSAAALKFSKEVATTLAGAFGGTVSK